MSGERFPIGNGARDIRQRMGTLLTDLDDGRARLKIVHPQGRRKPRGPGRWEYMITAGTIVAQRLGTVCPKKNGSRAGDVFKQ